MWNTLGTLTNYILTEGGGLKHMESTSLRTMQPPRYEARRSRGLIWVCDVAGSSRLLNRNETASATEEFLQRFLYLALLAVNSGNGVFVKWTGDGFLSFYETPLDREVGKVAEIIFDCARTLTTLVNVTQLCAQPAERIRIRHAVTYEKDALVIDLEHSGNMRSKDVLGRNVVSAFRMSGIACEFPGIVTQKEVLKAVEDAGLDLLTTFKALPMTAELRLRYFKGERFGSRDIYVSANRQPRGKVSRKGALKTAKTFIKHIEGGSDTNPRLALYRKSFWDRVGHGPQWCDQMQEVFAKEFLIPGFNALREFVNMATPAVNQETIDAGKTDS